MNMDVWSELMQFRRENKSGEPIILTLFHGTTHDFDSFDGTRVNMENMFGRQIYFTSSEDDAERNYASESGPDLKNRIERDAELLENEDEYFNSPEAARQAAKERHYGGKEAVLTIELTLRNPIIIGENIPHSIIRSFDDAYDEACDAVAEDEGVDGDVLRESIEDYEDLIHEKLDELTGDEFMKFEKTVYEALSKTGMTAADDGSIGQLFALFSEFSTPDEIFEALGSDERFLYLFEDETGLHNVKPVVAEVFHLYGHDAIILLDAKSMCHNMEIDDGTTHVALSLDCLEQARILHKRELSVEDFYDMSF